ncbi:endonuclease domain-containing protein [Microbacterium sp. GXF0217]
MHGLWIIDTPEEKEAPLHLWFGTAGEPRSCRRPSCTDVTAHWDAGRVMLGHLPPVENVLLQIAFCAGEEAFFVALESALRQSRVSARELRWLGSRLPPPMRWLLGFARTDADSGLESLVRLRLHRVGVTVRTQVQIDGVGEVDFVIGDRLIIEADGKENHDDADKDRRSGSRRHKDLLRDARAAALGYETLRFDYAMIIHDWGTVETAILARIAIGAHLRG